MKKGQDLRFKILIEQDKYGLYVASVPELPGCYTQGKTLEEVRIRIKEVVEMVLEEDESLKKDKISSPKSSSNFFGVEDITVRANA